MFSYIRNMLKFYLLFLNQLFCTICLIFIYLFLIIYVLQFYLVDAVLSKAPGRLFLRCDAI